MAGASRPGDLRLPDPFAPVRMWTKPDWCSRLAEPAPETMTEVIQQGALPGLANL